MYMGRILYHHVGVIFPFVINVPFLMREAQAKLAFTTENNQERGWLITPIDVCLTQIFYRKS